MSPMCRRLSVLLIAAGLALLVAVPPASAQKKVRESDLAPAFRDWLTMVSYIIHPREKDVFLRLPSDKDREIFVEAFWKQRDPTPGTPKNEYREEIEKRFAFVNVEFKKGSPKPGWMTDMGRIYMLLGAPVNRNEVSSVPELVPMQLWTYYGDTAKGQPTSFGLLFYRRSGAGEWTLYSPTGDGPRRLMLLPQNVSMDDSFEIYEYMRTYAPDIAPYTISIVPGDAGMDFSPSLRSDLMTADILSAPLKAVNPSYATHFMDYKGVVSTEYLTNLVECDSVVTVLPDPVEGVGLLHMSVAPRRTSVDYYEARDQYYSHYLVDISLKKGDAVVFQDSRDYSYYFAPADSEMVSKNGIALQDVIPLLSTPGTYALAILVRNTIGKEFSLYEGNIVIPPAGGGPRLCGPVFGYKAETQEPGTISPFKVLDRRVLVDAKAAFAEDEEVSWMAEVAGLTRELWTGGEVRVHLKGQRGEKPVEKDARVKLSDLSFPAAPLAAGSWAGGDLPPDYYEATVSLVDGSGRVLDTKTGQFMISPAKAFARPVILSKSIGRGDMHIVHYLLARECEQAGDMTAAESHFRTVVERAPEFTEGVVNYAGFLLRSKRLDEGLAMIERVKDLKDYRFDYCLVKGKLLKEAGRYPEALDLLLEGNRIYNSDVRLLNALGFCYWKTGQAARAREALEASLKLDPEQKEPKETLAAIGK